MQGGLAHENKTGSGPKDGADEARFNRNATTERKIEDAAVEVHLSNTSVLRLNKRFENKGISNAK